MILSLDTESTYAKDRDIRSLGVQRYLRHPDTDIYMASAFSSEFAAVHAPDRFPWGRLEGATAISHNAAYDQSVVAELRRRGMAIPQPKAWHCSADLAAYVQSPRSLADASRELLGIELSKEMRDFMKGKAWADLDPDTKVKLAEYCLLDSKASFAIWDKFSRFWPDHERAVSDHTAMMCRRGIGVDLARIDAGIAVLTEEKWKAEQRIPWAGKSDAKGKAFAIASSIQVEEHCRALGIAPPESTDSRSEEFDEWLELNGDKSDFILALQHWRKANRLLQLLTEIKQRQVDGILHYSLKYFGAPHTGHWEGDLGLNMLNFPRSPYAGVDARACLIPRPGKVFITADWSQIQGRIALWLANDVETLNLVRSGVDLYEAHARQTMGYKDPRPLKDVDKNMRQLAKARVLSLSFGSGARKLQASAKSMYGLDLTMAACEDTIKRYRDSNRGVTRLWNTLERGLRDSVNHEFESELPSGRRIRYFDVINSGGKLSARVERGKNRKFFYGSKLFQNVVAGIARDLLAAAILKTEDAGIPVVLHVHDELVCEVDASSAEDAGMCIKDIMEKQAPAWAEGLPIEAEIQIRKEYGK